MNNYKSVGDYFYSSNIGSGSFSTVYKGFNVKNQKIVAIKHITKFIDKKYINSEIELMKNISHKNIIKLYDVIFKDNKNTFLILEYCNSYDLSNYINTREDMFISHGNDYQECELDSRINYTGRFDG